MGEVLNSAVALSSTERFSDFQLIFWFSMVQALLFRFTLAALVAIFLKHWLKTNYVLTTKQQAKLWDKMLVGHSAESRRGGGDQTQS